MSGDAKVADVAARLRSQVPVNRGTMARFAEWYQAKYMKTGKATPLFHAMFILGVIGYAVEYPHLKHELEHSREEAKKL